MNFFNATLFGLPVWIVCAAVAVFLGGILLAIFTSKKGSQGKKPQSESFANADSNDGAVRDFMSTMRLSDTQRIDRLHRVVTLTAGQKADLKELTFDRLKKLIVTFGGVEQSRGQDYARIKLELGGANAECGASVNELGDNDFLVPRNSQDDPRCSIHYTSGKGDAVSFLQIKVQKFDPVAGSAAIEVLHLRGRQAA